MARHRVGVTEFFRVCRSGSLYLVRAALGIRKNVYLTCFEDLMKVFMPLVNAAPRPTRERMCDGQPPDEPLAL
jgi:hypothetical protein